jgi:hypothetical protein
MAIARLILTLQPQAYSGSELEELYPDEFLSKYTTTVGFKWRQSDMGPESWSLTIAAGYALGKLVSVFAGELSKDLYKWTKEKILVAIQKRKSNHGSIYIDCQDVWIEFTTFYPNEDLLDLFEQLPELLGRIDTSLCEDWSISCHDGEFIIEPNHASIRERLTTNTARDVDDIEIAEALSKWEKAQKS